MNKNILLIYHSQSGNTKTIADTIAKSILLEEDMVLNFKQANDTTIEDVKICDGIIICTPEYFGYMCGALKDFFDRTYDIAHTLDINKPYILFISCDNDGTGAERSIDTIARGYILKKAMDTIIIKQNQMDNYIETIEEVAIGFVNGIKMNIF